MLQLRFGRIAYAGVWGGGAQQRQEREAGQRTPVCWLRRRPTVSTLCVCSAIRYHSNEVFKDDQGRERSKRPSPKVEKHPKMTSVV